MARCCAVIVALGLTAASASGQGTPPQTAQPGTAQAPARDPSPKPATARISGRVVAADTGQPLRKAQVRATSPELKESRLATTDADGTYQLTDLPAGRYQLTASKGSFVQLQYGQTRPFEAGKPLQLADAEVADHVDFNLPRGALITGHVLDEFGDPVTDVQVTALRYRYVNGRRQLAPVGRVVMTNDVGEYRLFGLAPGQYFLSATLRANASDVSTDRSGYAPTYYPGTANLLEAQRVRVGIGQTLSDVSLALVPARLARVSGIAFDSDGKPLPGGLVGMMLATNSGLAGLVATQIRADGSFTIANVAPGDYTIRAVVPQTAVAAGALPELIASRITIEGEDVTGLRLLGVKSVGVSGKVMSDPAAPDARAGAPAAQLVFVPEVADPLGPGGLAKVNDDLTFEGRVQPGRQFLRLGGASRQVMLHAVRLNGTDVTDTGIDFRPGEDVAGLEVEVSRQVSQISGSVLDEEGRPAKDYTVVVFPSAPERWKVPASRYFGESRPDQDLRFMIRALPPGDYCAIAVDYLEAGAGTDPDFLERIQSRARTFSLADKESKTLDLKLVRVQ